MNTQAKLLAASVVVLLACAVTAPAQTTGDLIAIRAEADAALNAHDMEKWLSYWTEDGVLDWVAENNQYVGKEQVGAYFRTNLQGSPDLYTTEARVLAVENVGSLK